MRRGNLLGLKRRGKDPSGTISMDEIVRQQSEWKRLWQEAVSDANELRTELEILTDISAVGYSPAILSPERKRTGKGDATALLVCSDLHVYERVKPEEVNGLNEYNIAVARGSIQTMFQKALLLVDIERGAVNIDTFILALLGDLMTNQIHEDQLETNEGTPQEEMLFLMEQLTGGIDMLLEHGKFKRLIIPCCDGNHGRNTFKIRSANRVKHSHEWLLYRLLAQHYAGDPRVEFCIADGALLYMDIYGRKVRFTHGDAIRYNGGVGGLTIPARKAIAEWDRGTRADFTVFGHHHTSLMDKQFLSNGSALGYSPYAVTIKAAFEHPQQALVFLDDERWVTAWRPIYVR